MTSPGMHTLQSLAETPGDDDVGQLRQAYDALRTACAVVAGKLRKEAAAAKAATSSVQSGRTYLKSLDYSAWMAKPVEVVSKRF